MRTTLDLVNKFYPDVTTVVDSTKNVTIEVTKRDTNNNAVKNHKECALAVACKRKGADAAIICVKVAYLIVGTKAVRYKLPESVSREITSFDRNGGFAPGIYHLSRIPPTSRSDSPQKRAKPDPRRKRGRNPMHKTEDIRTMSDIK